MSITLPELPYSKQALSPHISEETLNYHYGKHHKAYVDKLNAQIAGSDLDKASLEEIVKSSKGGIFNNSAQVWNHSFYWDCLSPQGGGNPTGQVLSAIEKHFNSFEKFKEEFSACAMTQFGSGWAWLIKEGDNLKVISTPNAETPLTSNNQKALLTCDVWEHAYYIDYRNARNSYLSAFWNLVNWEFVNKNLDS
ncbi:MAG: superoxide dismutase [Fe] [Bdellovibrionaceae bacterium]|nr:superoxide dismutase [Fe] [Pseudobdellovibrionaceae bacterium]